jgi:O-antigen/teichoic acid export membrane protein
MTGWLPFIRRVVSANLRSGLYQAASQVAIIFVIILNSMNAIFAPMIADLYHRNEIERIDRLYKVSTKWGLYLILPLYLVICFIPQEFMAAIFGRAYILGANSLVILVTAQVINVGTGATGFLLIMTNHQNRWFITSGSTMILTLILNSILVPRFGMIGAAISTAVAISCLYLAGLLQVRILLNVWPYDRRYIKGVISALVASLSFILSTDSCIFIPL